MSRFLQLHALTFYPPSNLNRDDSGRPKTAAVGGRERLRISSQCLKRAWRTSELFQQQLGDHSGQRSKRIIAEHFLAKLRDAGIDDKKALEWSAIVAGAFGAVDKKKEAKTVETSQLVHYTPAEIAAIEALAAAVAERKSAPTKEEADALRGQGRAVDIALFGRMLADTPAANVDAAVQVAHAFTVNQVAMEEDFFTAVDDLNKHDEDAGAGHLDEAYFGSGVYYLYICVNVEQLRANLGGNTELTTATLRALTEAVVRVSPGGKQNSFAALSPAAYLLAEQGDLGPRSLALSYIQPIKDDLLSKAIERLENTRNNLDRAYNLSETARYTFKPLEGVGNLNDLLDFVGGACA